MSSPPVIEVRNIVKELGEGEGKVQVLRGVNLSLNRGELTLLMGPSGSGKTTLLSILGCILAPTSGQVCIAGERADGLNAERLAELRRRYVGFVFQSYNLFPTLHAVDNVRLALDVRGVPVREQTARAEEALRQVGLGHRLRSYPRNLSGGEKQRVAIARALASTPAVILADEPTAALDKENGHAVMALLAEIARDPTRAVLAVTHDPRTHEYADRIIHIEDGCIVGSERPTGASQTAKRRKGKTHA